MSVPDSLQYRGEKVQATPTIVEYIKKNTIQNSYFA